MTHIEIQALSKQKIKRRVSFSGVIHFGGEMDVEVIPPLPPERSVLGASAIEDTVSKAFREELLKLSTDDLINRYGFEIYTTRLLDTQ